MHYNHYQIYQNFLDFPTTTSGLGLGTPFTTDFTQRQHMKNLNSGAYDIAKKHEEPWMMDGIFSKTKYGVVRSLTPPKAKLG